MARSAAHAPRELTAVKIVDGMAETIKSTVRFVPHAKTMTDHWKGAYNTSTHPRHEEYGYALAELVDNSLRCVIPMIERMIQCTCTCTITYG